MIKLMVCGAPSNQILDAIHRKKRIALLIHDGKPAEWAEQNEIDHLTTKRGVFYLPDVVVGFPGGDLREARKAGLTIWEPQK